MHDRKQKTVFENTSYGRDNDLELWDYAWHALPYDVKEKLNCADLALLLERQRQAYKLGVVRGRGYPGKIEEGETNG